jgi:Tfp pilus assembly protein PilV
MLCHNRGQRGSQLAEALVAGIIILMITLALIDLIVMVLANNANDAAARNAARVAANQPDYPRALQAAQNSLNGRAKVGSFITALILQKVDYSEHNIVSCTTKMDLKLPVPVPGIGSNFVFMAKDTEPIVGH